MKPLKIAYFGTGEFSKNILSDLHEHYNQELDISLVVSQPDKAVGRKRTITPTPVHAYATEQGLDILQPVKVKNNPKFFSELEALKLDFIVVVAYGKIIPNEILDAPKYGCINIHGSILPDYRGASPIQESLKNGDTQTGLTIMYMSEGMDEGDLLKIEKIKIDKLDKTTDLFTKFEQFGARLLIETLQGLIVGKIKGIPQDESQATYCSKISKSDGEIDFQTMSSDEIFNKFRAYSPWPGIYSYFNDKKLNIEGCIVFDGEVEGIFEIGSVIRGDKKTIGIICADKKLLQLKQVKLEGKKSMDILSFVNGNKDFLDYKF
ncbi:methionyl-tRNA formyltransferase [Candidatus Gracilibacteria bacterium]|nr:methionyl-tRNA formyltransferase [Candidatus Gracilibacteria bacterium]